MCGSRKYPYPHLKGSLGLPRGKGVLKAKIFKEKYEPKLEFPEGWGVQTKKTLHGGRMDVFWNNTIQCHKLCIGHPFASFPLLLAKVASCM